MIEEIKKYLFENYRIKNSEIKSGRKVLSEQDLAKELILYSFNENLDWTKEIIFSSIKEWKESLEEIKSRPQEDIVKVFIADTIEKKGLKFFKDTWFKDNVLMQTDSVHTLFEAEIYNWNRENAERKISPAELKIKLQAYEIDSAHEQARKTFEALKFQENNKAVLKEWLTLIHTSFQIRESFPVFEMMFSHWLWQVKRRALGRLTRDELFINFYGKGGTGKTYLVKVITDPFKDFRVLNATINSLMDDRRLPELGNNFIHFCDELAASDGKNVFMDKDLSVLKTIITANEPLSYRPLGTNTQSLIKPRTSIIGAANFHIYEIVMDSSGMRRFFEFNVGLERNQYSTEDTRKIKELTVDAWAGIDENSDSGYWDFESDTNKEIMNIQDFYTRKDSFQLWFESVEYIQNNTNTQIKDAYQNYMVFCEDEQLQHKRISSQSLAAKLESEGVITVKMNGRKYIKGVIKSKEISNTTEAEFDLNKFGKRVSTNALCEIE